MRLRSPVLLALTAACVLPATASAAPPPILRHLTGLPAGRVGLPLSRAGVPRGGKAVGYATDSVHVLVGLRGRDEAGLADFVSHVSDPSSPSYQHFLTAAQFRDRFSPDQASVDAVRGFASQAGLKVGEVPSNRAFVELTGSAAAANRAFGTTLRAVRVHGRTGHLPSGTPSLPDDLARTVTTVEGLDTTRRIRPDASTYTPANVQPGPCSNYWGEKTDTALPDFGSFGKPPWAVCGYTPQQLRSAYGIDKTGLDGSGQSVAIIDAYDYPGAAADAKTWSANHGLPAPSYVDREPAKGLLPGTTPGDADGWAVEQQLDVEAVHAMAPAATISYRGAASPINVAFTMTQNDVVNNEDARIVSNSYGGAEDDSDANTDAVLAQAAATGIGFYFASGDQGDETQDPDGPGDREVDTSGNNPAATAVGGTALAVAADGSRQFETGWGNHSATLAGNAYGPLSYYAGGGGGTSQSYPEPDYQKGVVPDSIARFFEGKPAEASQTGLGFTPEVPGRAVPDVAMDADPHTGMLIGLRQDFDSYKNPNGLSLPTDTHINYGEFRVGGTSLASPLFAGVMALADQAAGKPHGFANPALYAASRSSGAFNDVAGSSKLAVVRKAYENNVNGTTDTLARTINDTDTIHAVTGYDDVTGLGTPNGARTIAALAPGWSPPTSLSTSSAGSPTSSSSTKAPAACAASRRSLRVAVRAARRDRLVKVVVQMKGRHTRTIRGHSVRALRVSLPASRHNLVITTLSAHGRRVRTTRSVKACAKTGRVHTRHLRAKRRRG